MCGVVGLFLKDPTLEEYLGRFTAAMLSTMTDRGPDSAGFAVYGKGQPQALKLTLRGPMPTDFNALAADLAQAAGDRIPVIQHDDHAVLTIPARQEQAVREALGTRAPQVSVVGAGCRMELYKDVGLPEDVTGRLGLAGMSRDARRSGTADGDRIGRHHDRRASVLDRPRPMPGPQRLALQPQRFARRLRREGISFRTENDTEVAAGYLSWRMRKGAQLGEALEASLADLDGFYTFVIGTESGFGVAARTCRLQAGGDGGDRALCRVRHWNTARSSACPASRAPEYGNLSRA